MTSTARHVLIVASFAESLTRFRGQLLRDLVAAGCTVTACAPEDSPAVAAELGRLGVRYQTYFLHRAGLNPLRDLRTLRALLAIMRAVQPDIVLGYTIKPVLYGTWAAWLAGVPRRFTMITGLGYAFGSATLRQRLVGLLVKTLYRLTLRLNAAVFFQNPDDRQLFIDLRLVRPEQTVLINGSGVELDKFAPAPPRPAPLTFLLIARLISEKGILDYVEAARLLRRDYPEARFRLLGPYDPNPTAIRPDQIAAWQAEGVIAYLGETQDVRPFLAETSVYVLPSFYREGTPRSVLEALAMARPVITTDAPGCRETVIDGENGFLVPPHDPAALAAAMRRFLDEPVLVASMGRRSRALAERKFDVRRVNAVILNTLQIAAAPAQPDRASLTIS